MTVMKDIFYFEIHKIRVNGKPQKILLGDYSILYYESS